MERTISSNFKERRTSHTFAVKTFAILGYANAKQALQLNVKPKHKRDLKEFELGLSAKPNLSYKFKS